MLLKRRYKYCSISFLFLFSCLNLTAQFQKRLYLANDDHTDLMWTANEVTYDSAFVHMLDYYLDQIEANINNPDNLQVRFNCDGSYWLRAYEKYRSPQQYEHLINRIRSGHISSPLNFLVSTYGAQPTEAVLRGMYPAGQLERDHNLRFSLAVAMENQTLPLGLSSLWAGAGAKYSWRGVCACASHLKNENLAKRKNQLYNYTGLDGRSVVMKWYARGRMLGGYAECRKEAKTIDLIQDLDWVLRDLDTMCDTLSVTASYPFMVAGAFGYGWDDLATFKAPEFVQAAKRYSRINRNVRVSNEVDFFEDITSHYHNLPSEQVSYGNEWDTYCTSMNETTAQVRRSIEKLRTAEALAALVAFNGKDFSKALEPVRYGVWESCGLYWEHDWTADGPVPQKERAQWQIKLQRQIGHYVDTLYQVCSTALARQLRMTLEPRFYVFNSLNWKRTDVVDFEYAGGPVRVIDLTSGKEVVSQILLKGNRKLIRILAEDIPSIGYKVYELRKGLPASFPQAALIKGEYLKTRYHRLRISPSGVITEWYDSLAKSRSLIRSADGKYVNDLGTKDKEKGSLTVENAGPVSVTVKAVSNDPVPHTVRITVFGHTSRIAIDDSIQSNFSDLKKWAFSFDLNSPTTHHEELGAILRVKKETRGGHYASQNARYDWQTFNHFADLGEKQYGITLSNIDCSFFTLGNSTPDSLWENSSQLQALAGGQTDAYPSPDPGKKDTLMLGIFAQNGQKHFRYQFALRSHDRAFDVTQEMKFALEHQNPLIAQAVAGDKRALPDTQYSLLSADDPSLILWSVKPAEEDFTLGLIMRFWNVSEQPVQTTIHVAKHIREAWQTSHIETNEKQLPSSGSTMPIGLTPRQINTYRIITEQK